MVVINMSYDHRQRHGNISLKVFATAVIAVGRLEEGIDAER